VLNDALGPVSEVYRAGSQGVLAVVEDFDTLCGLAVDSMNLFLVPSSMVIAACVGVRASTSPSVSSRRRSGWPRTV